MQIKTEQLNSHLAKQLLPTYLISGEVPLLIQESRDAIIKTAKKNGFTEHQRFTVDKSFDWSEVLSITQSYSLFGEKTIIDIRSENLSLSKAAKTTLQNCVESLSTDHIIILTLGKLTAAQKNSAWCKAINKVGGIITIWPIQPENFLSWIQQRARLMKLKLDNDATHALAQRTEGNLLATQQSLLKLQLLHPNEIINEQHIEKITSANSRHSVFDLSQSILLGQTLKSQQIITGLKQEGIDPTLVLWSISREIQTLIPLKNKTNQGASIDSLLTGRWFTRNNAIKKAIGRLSLNTLNHLLKKAHHTDLIIKGHEQGNPWLAIKELALEYCQSQQIRGQ